MCKFDQIFIRRCVCLQKLRRTSEGSIGRASHSSKEEEEDARSEEYASEQETGSSVGSSEGNRSDVEEEDVMEEEEGEKDEEDEDEEEEEVEEEEVEEEEEYELEEGDQREGNEQNDYDTRSEASDSQSESLSFSDGESVHSASGSDASGKLFVHLFDSTCVHPGSEGVNCSQFINQCKK